MVSLSEIGSAKWYPVCTNSRAEKKAFEALKNKGIDVYLPLNRQLKQWSDRKKWVEEPLFRSYLFVNIKGEDQTEVLKTPGVARFIYFSGKIATMQDKQMEDLKLLTASSLELEITEQHLKPGEKIQIKAGPLMGLSGEIISFHTQKKLVLRLENFGYSIIVHVPASLIDRF